MKSINRVVIIFVLGTFLIACNSIASKLNSDVKETARAIVEAGKHRVLETTTSKQVDMGQGTRQSTCTCKAALWLNIQPVSGDANNWKTLCLSKDHEQLINYASLRHGDFVSFAISEHMLDMECNGSASTFLKLQK